MVIAAYGSGHIRMFLVREPILLCEVAAHARWITALDVAPESRLALTVAEDSFVRVWQIEKNADEVVSIDGNTVNIDSGLSYEQYNQGPRL